MPKLSQEDSEASHATAVVANKYRDTKLQGLKEMKGEKVEISSEAHHIRKPYRKARRTDFIGEMKT